MHGNHGWTAVLLLIVVGGAAIIWQHRQAIHQRDEVASLRMRQRELDQMQAENRRLRSAGLSDEQLDRLRAEHAALTMLQSEMTSLRNQVAEAERIAAQSKAQREPVERFAVGIAMPAGEWKNQGAATPGSALETALWAAAGGDVGALAERIALDGKSKSLADALLNSLPPAMRTQFNSPEQLIAFLTIKDIPTGEAKVREWTQTSERLQTVELALMGSDGSGKEVRLALVRPSARDEWKLGVMPAAVAKYAAMLEGELARPVGK